MAISSRERFKQYRNELGRRREAGELKNLPGYHSTAPARPLQRTFASLFWGFIGLLRPYRSALLVAFAALTVATLARLVPPLATKVVVDTILPTNSVTPIDERHRLLWLVAAGVLAASLTATAAQLFGRWRATAIVKRLQTRLRRMVFDHASRLPLHRIHQIKSGGVSSLLREDGGSVGDLVFGLLINPARAALQLLGSLAILAWVDYRLLLAALALVPAVFFTHKTWIGRIRPLFRDIREQRQGVDAHAAETFGGMRVVRGFGRERAEAGRFVRGGHLMTRQELLAWWWMRGVDIAWELLIPVASGALLVYGGGQVLAARLTLGELMLFLFYLTMLLEPMAVLASTATELQTSLAGLDRMLDLLAEPTEFAGLPASVTFDKANIRGRVELRGVRFRYPGSEKDVLDGVDLIAEPGKMVALVGPSGAGKTTLLNLVARFHDPTAGQVLVDGVDLATVQPDSHRRLLGIVEQDVFLFDGTIGENIAYGRPDASAAEIAAAAQAANAAEFIDELPERYETVIGERGVRLSGGQRQRLAIARALLADPKLLLLDEATSNLDTESERAIQDSLARLLAGRTSFVVAHRLSTIAHADLILFVEHGRIVERGTHRELMAQGGRYKQMVDLQSTGDRLPLVHAGAARSATP